MGWAFWRRRGALPRRSAAGGCQRRDRGRGRPTRFSAAGSPPGRQKAHPIARPLRVSTLDERRRFFRAPRARLISMPAFASVDDVIANLRSHSYVCDRRIATAIYLADRMEKPILVEGPAGVGKTELAKTLAA